MALSCTESHIMDCSSWLGSTIALGNHLIDLALLPLWHFDCNDWLLVWLRRIGRLIIYVPAVLPKQWAMPCRCDLGGFSQKTSRRRMIAASQ